jgi:hypothetical protein
MRGAEVDGCTVIEFGSLLLFLTKVELQLRKGEDQKPADAVGLVIKGLERWKENFNGCR